MKTCPPFFCRFLLVFFLVLPGTHSHSAQRADAQANVVDATCLCCTFVVLSLIIGGSMVIHWLQVNKLEPCEVSLRSLQTENEAQDKRILGLKKNLKTLRAEAKAINISMLECEASLGTLQTETEVKGSGILECKKNLKTLRAEAEARNISMLECEANLGALQAETEVKGSGIFECKENLKSLQAEAEAKKLVALECRANLNSLQAEAESGYMHKAFLSWSKWQWVCIELGSGALLPPVAYLFFNHIVPFGYRRTYSLLAVLFMMGVTNLIYGAGRVFIILGDFIHETDLTEVWWEDI